MSGCDAGMHLGSGGCCVEMQLFNILVLWMVIVIMVMVITYNDNDDHVNIRIVRMQRRDALGFGLMLRRDAVVLADMMQLRVSRMRPRYPIDLQLCACSLVICFLAFGIQGH